MSTIWTAADESGHREEIEAETAQEAAEEYVSGGEWGSEPRTRWATVTVWNAADEDSFPVRCKVEIPATAPRCVDKGAHRFEAPHRLVGGCEENPGIFGSGGGVRIHEVCVRCGCGRVIDTWAHDPTDGEEGLTSETFEPGAYDIDNDENAAEAA